MLGLVVASAFIFIQGVQGGYSYPKPSVAFQLPQSSQAVHQHASDQDSSQDFQKTISYTVGIDDYSFLNQHNKERIRHTFHALDNSLNSNIDASVPTQSDREQIPMTKEQDTINVKPILNTENDVLLVRNENNVLSSTVKQQNIFSQILNLQDVQNINTKLLSESDNSLNAQNTPPAELSFNGNYSPDVVQSGLPSLGNIQSAPTLLNVHNSYRAHYDRESAPQTLIGVERPSVQPIFNLQQTQDPLIAIQSTPDTQLSSPQLLYDPSHVITNSGTGLTLIAGVQNESFGSLQNSNLNSDAVPTPVITKQISFHVPPPDTEEESVLQVQSQAPKKVYKILFIKLPHQEYTNKAQLQASLNNRLLAAIEEKTIIYVLSKKPDTEISAPLVTTLPQQNVFNHEVFFVKYSEDSKVTSNEVNNLIHENPTPKPGVAILNAAPTTWK